MPTLFEDRRTPRYVQVIDYIQDHIMRGEWGPHHKVPSEDDLSNHFSFARGTIRQAINELVNSGILYRIQGKGTFVGPKLIQHDVSTTGFRSFLDEFIDKNVVFETIQLGSVIVPMFSPVSDVMHLDSTDKRLVKIQRLRTTCGEPFMYSENHIPLNRYPGISELDFTHHGIYEVLQSKYDLKVGLMKRYFQAVKAEGDAARLLKVATGSPLILIEQIVFDGEDVCTDYAFIWFRSDKVRISVDMNRH